MSSTTMARGLLGNFPLGVYPPVTDQRDPPLPVRLPTSSPIRTISESGAGGRGALVGASGRRSPRDGRGGGGGAMGEDQGRRRSNERRNGGGEDNNRNVDNGSTSAQAT